MQDKLNDSMKNKLYEYRVLNHLSQSELAKKVGVSTQTIHSIEKGLHIPSIKLAFRISNFFNVSVTEIFLYSSEDDQMK